jgi:hypothetical protein
MFGLQVSKQIYQNAMMNPADCQKIAVKERSKTHYQLHFTNGRLPVQTTLNNSTRIRAYRDYPRHQRELYRSCHQYPSAKYTGLSRYLDEVSILKNVGNSRTS